MARITQLSPAGVPGQRYGTFSGKSDGSITGTSSQSFSGSGTLTTAIPLTGTSSIAFSSSGTLTTGIRLTGTTAQSFSGSGTLTTAIRLTGTSSATFSASGTLVGTDPSTAITQPRFNFPYTGRRYGSFSKTADHAVTLTAPRLVQRDGAFGLLAVSGTYNSVAADTVQFKLLRVSDDTCIIDWSDIDAVLSGNVWSGTVSIPTGGPYYCQARLVNSSDSVLASSGSSSSLICGDVFVNLGQSNADGRGDNNQTYSGASVAWGVDRVGTFDTTLSDPLSTTGDGSWVPLLATLISAHTGSSVPLAFITVASGGSQLHNGDWHPPTGGEWVIADALIDSLNLNGVKAVLWLQGERDARVGTSQVNYTATETLFASYVAGWPGAPRLISTLIGEFEGQATDANIDNVRFAKISNWDDGITDPGANPIDMNMSGAGVHYATNAELGEIAGRMWLAVKRALYSGGHGRGPRVLAANYTGAVITATMDQPLETATSYTTSAWIVKVDGVAVTVSSVAKAGPDQIVLTLAAAPSGVVTVTFGSGDDAIVAALPRATAKTLPVTINGIVSVSIPAEPLQDYVISPDTPEFMHGTLCIRPYVVGDIFASPYVSGKVLAAPHLLGEIGLNP